jgi:hypothetical protein
MLYLSIIKNEMKRPKEHQPEPLWGTIIKILACLAFALVFLIAGLQN